MHTLITLELWKMLVLVVAGALPITFVIYWLVASLMRVPSTLREFLAKINPFKTAVN